MTSSLTDPIHESYLALALAEARKGVGRTHPNPPVGAVIVRDGVVVGRGHHRRAGMPHAEVEAIRDAGERARGADIYVTLEPHDHQGRTPPCTRAIIDAGLKRVFVGTLDPNPLVSGKGVRTLLGAGLEVRTGLCAAQCEALIRPFSQLITSGRPLVVLKAATSLDGKLATRTGDSRWVSSPASRELVHLWRDELDAILVGAGTVRADDPLLTTRLAHPIEGRRPRNPLRVVVSGRQNLPENAAILDASVAGTIIYAAGDVRPELTSRGAELVSLPDAQDGVDFTALFADLARRGISSVLVEGGAAIHAALLSRQLVDEVRLFVAPKIVGADGLSWVGALGIETMAEAWQLRDLSVERVGDDLLVVGRPTRGV